MLRWLVALALLLPALAGCSSDPEEDPVLPAMSSSASTSARQLPREPLTDTLHLLDAPHVAGRLDPTAQTIRIALPSDLNSYPSQADFPTWTLPPIALAEVRAVARLTIEVDGVITPYSYPILGAAMGACVWNVVLHEADDSKNQVVIDRGIASRCIREFGVVSSGIRELEFVMPRADLSGLEGIPLAFSLYVEGAYAPGTTVDLLTGSAEADSTLTIERLQLPLSTMTLTH